MSCGFWLTFFKLSKKRGEKNPPSRRKSCFQFSEEEVGIWNEIATVVAVANKYLAGNYD
jgi:hypothetical protein